MAVNCWVVPLEMVAFAGVTAMDKRLAAVTVKVVVPKTIPRVALMVVVPTPTPAASPSVAVALEMVATPAMLVPQVTLVVKSWVEASL